MENQFPVQFLFLPEMKLLFCLCKHSLQFKHVETEFLAVFGSFNCFNINTNYLYTIFFPDSCFFAINCQIQCSLSTHGWKNSINFMLLKNFND